MNNPKIETDLATILNQINSKLDKIAGDVFELKLGQTKLEGKIDAVESNLTNKINAVDSKLTSKIDAVDLKFTGKIETLDSRVGDLDKRLGNVEFANRGIFVGLLVLVLGGAVKLSGLLP